MTFKEWKKEHGYTTKKNRHVFSACISCVHCGESGTISPRSPHLMAVDHIWWGRYDNPAATLGRRGGLKGGAVTGGRKAEASRANGKKGGRPKDYTLRSIKSGAGNHCTVSGLAAAKSKAREIQADIQAAYGVDVVDGHGRVVYTAE